MLQEQVNILQSLSSTHSASNGTEGENTPSALHSASLELQNLQASRQRSHQHLEVTKETCVKQNRPRFWKKTDKDRCDFVFF